MKEYYIHVDGKKLGPFSPEDLQNLLIGPETLISRTGMEWPVAASEIDELKPIVNKAPEKSNGAVMQDAGPIDKSRRPGEGVGGSMASGIAMRIAIIALLIAVIGTAIYYLTRKRDDAPEKDNISTIHEREVQKAIKELKAEKVAKKAAEQRRKLLNARKAELRALNAQLGQVSSRKSAALDELDDIRRPRLFRSKAKKEKQLAEQQQVVDRLERKAASLRLRISRCQAAIDTLSAGP